MYHNPTKYICKKYKISKDKNDIIIELSDDEKVSIESLPDNYSIVQFVEKHQLVVLKKVDFSALNELKKTF